MIFYADLYERADTASLLQGIGYSPFMQEFKGSTPTGGTCPNDFPDPTD